MKITLPLSFLLCLPAMAMAKQSPPGALLLRGSQQGQQAVDVDAEAEAEAGQRSLTKSGKTPSSKKKSKKKKKKSKKKKKKSKTVHSSPNSRRSLK
eukprot:scaffold31634_cov80-Skeletonema_dohrnii-CCMP3373.AAC.4